MKTSHKIKIFPLGMLTAITFILPLSSLAVPWSEQDAFCMDRVIYSIYPSSNHSNQKIYNECMDNADALIKEYERNSKVLVDEWWQQREKNQIEWAKERAEENERRKIEEIYEKLQNDTDIKKYDDLLSEF